MIKIKHNVNSCCDNGFKVSVDGLEKWRYKY